MAKKISEMINILEKEVNLYKTLLDLSAREKDAMTRYSLEDLVACQKIRKSMNLQSKELEESRCAVMSVLSQEMQRPVSSLTVSMLMHGAQPDEVAALKKCRADLKRAVELFLRVNGENQAIARESLSFIDKSVKILSGYNPSGTVYKSDGMIEMHDKSGSRMRREV